MKPIGSNTLSNLTWSKQALRSLSRVAAREADGIEAETCASKFQQEQRRDSQRRQLTTHRRTHRTTELRELRVCLHLS